MTQKQAHILFAVIMVGGMTFIVTGISTFINNAFTVSTFKWMRSWAVAYAIALPIMLLFSPPLRKVLQKYTRT